MKTTSAGTFIINEYNEILVGVVTGQKPLRYDLPKGMIEPLESSIDAAIRECQEEFGYSIEKDKMIDIGLFKYNSQKNLHVFKIYVKKDSINMSDLECTVDFSIGDRKYPEINGYAWVNISDISEATFAKSMFKVINNLKEKGVLCA